VPFLLAHLNWYHLVIELPRETCCVCSIMACHATASSREAQLACFTAKIYCLLESAPKALETLWRGKQTLRVSAADLHLEVRALSEKHAAQLVTGRLSCWLECVHSSFLATARSRAAHWGIDYYRKSTEGRLPSVDFRYSSGVMTK
jgi:hypothetical protein